jgi:hypothetical protein
MSASDDITTALINHLNDYEVRGGDMDCALVVNKSTHDVMAEMFGYKSHTVNLFRGVPVLVKDYCPPGYVYVLSKENIKLMEDEGWGL